MPVFWGQGFQKLVVTVSLVGQKGTGGESGGNICRLVEQQQENVMHLE